MSFPKDELIIFCTIILISLAVSFFFQNGSLDRSELFVSYLLALAGIYLIGRLVFMPLPVERPALAEAALILLAPLILAFLPVSTFFYGFAASAPFISLFMFLQVYVGVKLLFCAPKVSFTVPRKVFLWAVIALVLISVLVRFVQLDGDFLDYHGWRQYQTILIAKEYFLNRTDLISPLTDYAKASDKVFTINGLEFQFLPLLSQPLFHAFGITNWDIRIVPVLLSLISLALFYVLQKKLLGSSTAALLSCVLFALLPLNVFISRAYMPEGLSMVLLLVFLNVYAEFRKSNGMLPWLFISETLLFLSKPPLVTLVLPFAVYELVCAKKDRVPFLAAFIAATAIVVLYYLLELVSCTINGGNSVIGNYSGLLDLLNYGYYLYLIYGVALLVSSAFLLVFFLKGLMDSFVQWKSSGEADLHLLLFAGVCLYALAFSTLTWNNTYYLTFWSVPVAGLSMCALGKIKSKEIVLSVVLLFFIFVMPSNARFFSGSTVQTTRDISASISTAAAKNDLFLLGICSHAPDNINPELVYLSGKKALYIGLENQSAADIESILRENSMHVYAGPPPADYNPNQTSLRLIAAYPSSDDCNVTDVLILNNT